MWKFTGIHTSLDHISSMTDMIDQVVVGDQLTCKNIRAMKAWTLTEAEQKHRLQWAHEVPGNNYKYYLT